MYDIIPANGDISDIAFKIPSLTEKEEKELSENYYFNGDIESARKIVLSYLKLVVKIANGMSGYGLDRQEVIQEGSVGLMKAIKNYNPTLGIKVSTYASDWIRASILDYVVKQQGVVRRITTKAHRKVFFNINKYRDCKGIITDSSRTKMSDDLGLSLEEVNEAIGRLASQDITLLTGEADDDDYGSGNLEFNIESDTPSPEEVVIENQYEEYTVTHVRNALETLNDREKHIIESRWMGESKESLHSLSEKLNVSAERVRQLEAQAIKRLKKYLEENSDFVH
jgi:RNA polymerase sigma-32 factor